MSDSSRPRVILVYCMTRVDSCSLTLRPSQHRPARPTQSRTARPAVSAPDPFFQSANTIARVGSSMNAGGIYIYSNDGTVTLKYLPTVETCGMSAWPNTDTYHTVALQYVLVS